MKVKTNFKFLITLGIMLLVMLLIGTTKVNAESSILSNIPDSFEVNVPSTNCYEVDLSNTIKSYITEDISNYILNIQFVKTTNTLVTDVNQMLITLRKYDGTVIETKTINIVYSDDSKRNDTDKKYVENAILNTNFNLTFEHEICTKGNEVPSIIKNQIEEVLSNADLEYIETDMGSGEVTISGFAGTEEVTITKNGVAYFSVCFIFSGQSVITVPSSVEDSEQAITDYSLSKIKEYMKNFEYEESDINSLTITKGTEQDKYIVNYTSDGINEEKTVIIRKIKQETVTAKDTTTNIKLDTNTNVVPADTVLEVDVITEGTTYNKVKTVLSNVNNFKVFDITLKSNGVAIQPNGNVKISIPIPSEFDTSNLVVYRVEDDGTKVKYDVTVEDGYAVFETDHFSTYVLADGEITETQNTQTSTETSDEKDETPKTGVNDIIGYVLAITVLAGVGIVAVKKISK